MNIHLTRDPQGVPFSAEIELTRIEALIIHRHRVPMAYQPGGFCLSEPDKCNIVKLSGACFVDTGINVLLSLQAFRAAMAEALQDPRNTSL